jgi:hypothetical protein
MRQLTIERSAVIILFALLFALATRIPLDTDTWWHIRCGEYMLTKGMIYADPFSFTKFGESWTNHSWGSQIILYGVWRLAGNFGLAIYTSLLATAGMIVVYRMCAGNVYLRAFALVISAATAAVFWSPRPQMISFLLSTVIVYLLYLQKREKVDRLWWIPVIMGLWGNLHAGFSIGFILLAGAIVGEALSNLFNSSGKNVVPWHGVRKLVVVTVLSVGALLVNPYGLNILTVPFQTVTIGALQNFIQEWNSPNFHERQTWPFIVLLMGLFGAVGGSRQKLDWTDFVLVSGTVFLALLAGRNIATFAVVATPVLTYHADTILTERGWVLRAVRLTTSRLARLNLVLVTIISLGALAKVLIVLDSKSVGQAQEQYLPVKVAQYLNSERPAGPMFNNYNWGGYLMFAAPEYPVFVDGRTDLYGDEFLNNYLQTVTGRENWQQTLDDYGVSLVVIEPQSGLARALRADPGWHQDYADDLAVVFIRENANG